MNCELSCCLDIRDPDLAHVGNSVRQLIGFLRDHGVSDPTFLSQFELACAEAINNAVEHGCANAQEKFFHARIYIRPEYAELRVLDPSDFKGWDYEPLLPDDPFDEGGRGHFLMCQMTDEILHETSESGHVLILRKRFAIPWEYIPGQADATLCEMTDELVASYEMISTLIGLGEWLATAPDMDAFIDGALERLCSVTGAGTAYVRLDSGGSLKLSHQWGKTLVPLQGAIETSSLGMESEVFRTGQEVTIPLDSDLPLSDPLTKKIASGFIAPILFKDARRGILFLGKNVVSSFFDAGKLKIARTVAEYLGIITELGALQKRRSEDERSLRELEIAAQIQLSLMPSDFSGFRGLDVFGTCRPALQAGGDYFETLPLPDGSTLCVIADVMGKGLPAALLAAMLRTNLRAIVSTGKHEPHEIVASINRLMSDDLIHLEMFITMVCVKISPDHDRITLSSAGHLAAIVQRKSPDKTMEDIDAAGLPIGVFPDSDYASETFAFHRGDRILLYTDGIVEAENHAGKMFDYDRVKFALSEKNLVSSKDALEELLEQVNIFTGGAAPSDDRTAILISRTL